MSGGSRSNGGTGNITRRIPMPESSGTFALMIDDSSLEDETEEVGELLMNADLSIAPDGSFVETSSALAARELKKRYDWHLGINLPGGQNLQPSPFATMSFTNQHGKPMYRIGRRDIVQAPALSAQQVDDQLAEAAAVKSRRATVGGSRLSSALFNSNKQQQPSSSQQSNKLRKTRSIPDLLEMPGLTVPQTQYHTQRKHSQSVTSIDLPPQDNPPMLPSIVPSPGLVFSKQKDLGADGMWAGVDFMSGLSTGSALPSLPVESDHDTHATTYTNPFGSHVVFDNPLQVFSPSTSTPQSPVLRQVQSFESGLTARPDEAEGEPAKAIRRPPSAIKIRTQPSLASLAKVAAQAEQSMASPPSPSPSPSPVPPPSTTPATTTNTVFNPTTLQSRYTPLIFDVLHTYRGLPTLDHLLSGEEVIRLDLSREREREVGGSEASPRDDPRFVIWGWVTDDEGEEGRPDEGGGSVSRSNSNASSSSSAAAPSARSSHSMASRASQAAFGAGKHISQASLSRASSIAGSSSSHPNGSNSTSPNSSPQHSDQQGQPPSGQRVILAATIERWIAQLTSEMSYATLLDFFITYRTYVSEVDLAHLLICRFHWSLWNPRANRSLTSSPNPSGEGVNSEDDTPEDPSVERDLRIRRIVRVRTFVAIRYWLLTFWTVDFVRSRELRLLIAEWLNTLSKDPILKGPGMGDAKNTVKKLKKVVKDCKRAHHYPSANDQSSSATSQDNLPPSSSPPSKPPPPKHSNGEDSDSDLDLDFDFDHFPTSPGSSHSSVISSSGFVDAIGGPGGAAANVNLDRGHTNSGFFSPVSAVDGGSGGIPVESHGILQQLEASPVSTTAVATPASLAGVARTSLSPTSLRTSATGSAGPPSPFVQTAATLPIHTGSSLTLTKVFVKTMGRLGRWKRVLNPSSPSPHSSLQRQRQTRHNRSSSDQRQEQQHRSRRSLSSHSSLQLSLTSSGSSAGSSSGSRGVFAPGNALRGCTDVTSAFDLDLDTSLSLTAANTSSLNENGESLELMVDRDRGNLLTVSGGVESYLRFVDGRTGRTSPVVAGSTTTTESTTTSAAAATMLSPPATSTMPTLKETSTTSSTLPSLMENEEQKVEEGSGNKGKAREEDIPQASSQKESTLSSGVPEPPVSVAAETASLAPSEATTSASTEDDDDDDEEHTTTLPPGLGQSSLSFAPVGGSMTPTQMPQGPPPGYEDSVRSSASVSVSSPPSHDNNANDAGDERSIRTSSSNESFGVPLSGGGTLAASFRNGNSSSRASTSLAGPSSSTSQPQDQHMGAPWQFDVVSIDQLELSDLSSDEDSDRPAAPPGLRKPSRKLPMRRDFEFVQRPESSVVGHGAGGSMTLDNSGPSAIAYPSSGSQASSQSSADDSSSDMESVVWGNQPIQQWQMNSLLDSLTDNGEGDGGDVDDALRRLEGQIGNGGDDTERRRRREDEKRAKVDGWLRVIKDRLERGEYADEEPRWAGDDEEEEEEEDGDDGETELPETAQAEEESQDEQATPQAAEMKVPDKPATPEPPQAIQSASSTSTSASSSSSRSGHTSPHSKPAPEDAVPAEILQSRMSKTLSMPDPQRLSISRFVTNPSSTASPLHATSQKQPSKVHRSFILIAPLDQLAQHFAMIDRELFMGVKFEELISMEWLTPPSSDGFVVLDWAQFLKDRAQWKNEMRYPDRTSALAAVRARFDLIANFVASEIVLTPPNHRVQLINRFIRLAFLSNSIQNYNTAVAIVTGLRNPYVIRILESSSSRKIGHTEAKMMRALDRFTSSAYEYLYLRKAVKAVSERKTSDGTQVPTEAVPVLDSQTTKTKIVIDLSACVPFIGIYLVQLQRYSALPDLIDPTDPTRAVGIDPITSNFESAAHPEIFDALPALPPSIHLEPLINVQKQRLIASVVKSLVQGQHLATRVNFPINKKLFQKCLRLRGLDDKTMERALGMYSRRR